MSGQKPEVAKRSGGDKPPNMKGPWPFITFRRDVIDGKAYLWQSRAHRKGLIAAAEQVWPTPHGILSARAHLQINRAIGIGFGIGSLFFLLGSTFSLLPKPVRDHFTSETQVNVVSFVGSIAFTIAAYIQVFQSANAGPTEKAAHVRPTRKIRAVGWRPADIGWLSSVLQFIGTLLFNASTYDAILGGGGWFRQDLTIWGPDFVGSSFFLASGYLAYSECCDGYWRWKPGSLSWWIVFVNLVGCVAFMGSAVFAFVPLSAPSPGYVLASNLLTLVGSAGFLVGSLLLFPECSPKRKMSLN